MRKNSGYLGAEMDSNLRFQIQFYKLLPQMVVVIRLLYIIIRHEIPSEAQLMFRSPVLLQLNLNTLFFLTLATREHNG